MKIGDFDFDDPLSLPDDAGSAAVTGSIVERLAEMVRTYPDRIAVCDEAGTLTYGELARRSHRVARFIMSLELPRESLVGVMTGRNAHYLVGLMGVLVAGCAFVPLDPAIPLERRRQMVRHADIALVLSESRHIGVLHLLQWRCPGLRDILCLDSGDIDALAETPGSLMSVELWDHLAGDRADDVLAGGWKSAFTGQPIPTQAMAGFGENARRKTAAFLTPDSRVLEIGCASGFTMRHVAPNAGLYIATDLSRRNVERTETFAVQHGLRHVTCRQLAAHDIDVFEPGSFDLIILNSVVENFPGFGYLRIVLDKVARLLAPGGTIFLGNIWDGDRRDAYLADLAAFARENAGKGYDTRLDFAEDLFVPEGFFADWVAERGGFVLSRSAVDAPGFDPAAYTFDLTLTATPEIAPGQPARRRHDQRALDMQADTAPEIATSASDLAYVLFTSGTSGTPKGVMIEHGAVVNLAHAVAQTQLDPLGGAERGLRLTCVAPFAFDGSIVQLFAALLNGHAVHIPETDTRMDPAALDGFLHAHRIDQLDATPSLFALLLDHWEEGGGHCAAGMVVLGGESVPASLPERFFALAGHRDAWVVNAYGPTECCVSAAQYVMTAQTYRHILPPPIGRPIPGVTIDICDESGRSLPPGIPGEICIGGAGVGRGYLGDALLTRRRFHTDAAGARHYRSGDIGRRRPDGEIHFVGREDRQVKIRGNRVELGDVEAALLACPHIRQAVALLNEPAGGATLIAYVVADAGFGAAACKTQLERALPAYMVPSSLIEVDEIPLTVTGKLDIARLPVQGPADAAPARPARPLEGALERQIARLMGEVLDRPIKDADADFFALGGHSVLAVQFLSKLNRGSGTALPLSDLFTCSTVRGLARRIAEREKARDRQSPVVAVNTEGRQAPIVCFSPVGGNVLCYRDLARALGPDRPVYMVEALGLRDGETPASTVEEMVASALPYLRAALPDGPVILLGWSFGGLLAHEAAFRLQQAGVDVRHLILLDAVAVPETIKAILRKDEADYLADMFGEIGSVDAETLRPLTPEQRLDLLVEQGKATELLPQDTDRAAMRRLLAVFQNNALAAVRYAPPALDGLDILLVRPREASRMAPGVPGDDYNGWRALHGDRVTLHWMDGSHGTMLVEPHVRALTDLIADQIGMQEPV